MENPLFYSFAYGFVDYVTGAYVKEETFAKRVFLSCALLLTSPVEANTQIQFPLHSMLQESSPNYRNF